MDAAPLRQPGAPVPAQSRHIRPGRPPLRTIGSGELRSTATLIAVAVLVLTTWALPSSLASCAPFSTAEAVARAEVLLVGVATANREQGAYTKFNVEEVWKGPDLAPKVWVQGGQDQPPWPFNHFIGVNSSNDVRFEVGERYLIAASAETFKTEACTATRTFDPRLREYAPSSIRGPNQQGLAGANAPPSILLLDVATMVALLGLALAAVLTLHGRISREHNSASQGQ